MTSRSFADPENHKAGLVSPAFACGTGSVNLVSTAGSECQNQEALAARAAGSPSRATNISYITIARFSSSYCNTGRAHPAISTRPAASRAALGETP